MTEIRTRTEMLDALIRQLMGLHLTMAHIEESNSPMPPKSALILLKSNVHLFGAVVDMIVDEDNIPDVEMDLRMERAKDEINSRMKEVTTDA